MTDPKALIDRARQAARAFAHQEGVEATLFEDLATALEQALERVGALEQSRTASAIDSAERLAAADRLVAMQQRAEAAEKERDELQAKMGPATAEFARLTLELARLTTRYQELKESVRYLVDWRVVGTDLMNDDTVAKVRALIEEDK